MVEPFYLWDLTAVRPPGRSMVTIFSCRDLTIGTLLLSVLTDGTAEGRGPVGATTTGGVE